MNNNFNAYPNNNFNAYPNNNFNAYPNNNFNRNVGICNMCSNTGITMFNGMQQPCQCGIKSNIIYETNNFNVVPRHQGIISQTISKTFNAIANCIPCSGTGYRYRRNGQQKYCYDCIKVNGYCHRCNGTGYKASGRRCKCGMY